ncbi:MAG: PAS domain-containing protein [Desulfobacterales bacterium]|nr:PAS domain-containing protein [Desulfobacterales bacterium]
MKSKSCRIFNDHSDIWNNEFIDNIPVAIYRTTFEGNLVFCNRALAQIFGFDTVEELIDYPIIDLYRNKRDRGLLIQALTKQGRVADLPLAFIQKTGIPIWCAITATPVFDDDGYLCLLDGIVRDITQEIEESDTTVQWIDETIDRLKDVIIIFDLQGEFLDINKAGIEFLGIPKQDLLGKPLLEFIVPKYRDVLPLFFADILRTGREGGILTVMDRNDNEHHIEFDAFLVKKAGRAHHVKGIFRDVTKRIKYQRERLKEEKFQGVLEMAGGVAHRLNQPLTVINNIINEILTDLKPNLPIFQKINQLNENVNDLNEIIKKIGNIKKYEAMDYVAGVRIVDIDKAI